MKTIVDKARIEEMFVRGTVMEAFPSKEKLMDRLLSGERIKIYYGLDPTHTAIHLGHAKNLIFLEELRQLGHEVVVLFGDFTAMIGDPTSKAVARKQLTADEVKMNMTTWVGQIRPLIDFDDAENPATIAHNSEWLSKLSFADVVNLASNFTVQQMLERDMFEKRLKDNVPIHVHEFMYPLMQGYDSVAMDVDIEMCGMDQKFNALAGRTLLKKIKNKEKFVFITTLLENPKTKEKMMSKSLGTGVFLDFEAGKMYGSLMAQDDENTRQLFVDCTWLDLEDIEHILGVDNPRDAKTCLAFEITKIYHGEEKARLASKDFDNTFKSGNLPENIKEVKVKTGKLLMDVVSREKLVSSKSDFRRLIAEGAVSNAETKEKITDPFFKITDDVIIRIGPLRFLKIVVG